MHTSRRTFLKTTAFTFVGTSVISKELLAEAFKQGKVTGVQLYSVRNDMQKDPLGTLKQISGMGFRYVEHANYVGRKFYGHTATEFKKILNDLNLKMPSGHTVLTKQHWDDSKKDFTDAWKDTVEDAATVGQEYVISPYLEDSMRKDINDLKRFLNVFNKSGELCKKHGMKFGYHNHDFEFNEKLDNMLLYDIILQNTDPKLVIQQMDIGNMYATGGRAMDLLKKYPGRFASMHVKDEVAAKSGNEKFESAVLGTGVIGVKEVIDYAAKHGGTKYFIIEQESYQGKSPLESVKEDLQIMKKWGY